MPLLVNWDGFEAVVKDAAGNWFQQPITWKRFKGGIDEFGEDNQDAFFDSIDLKCLVFYNEFRTWPITEYTDAGEIDEESVTVFMNLSVLGDLGYLDAKGNFAFKPEADSFILNGIIYRCAGWTNMSQTNIKPLMIQMIMKKPLISTGDTLTNH